MPSTPPVELKRHYRQLSPKEADSVVDVVADLIVNFLKIRSDSQVTDPGPHADETNVGDDTPPSKRNGR